MKVAQLIIERIAHVSVKQTDQFASSSRGTQGFGSTGEQHTPPPESTEKPTTSFENPQQSTTSSPVPIPYTNDEINKPTVRSYTDRLGDLWLSHDPFGPTLTMEVTTKGTHPTVGLQLDDNNINGRLYLRHCEKRTPAARMKKWRTNLRNSNLLRINDIPVSTLEQVKQIVADARANKTPNLLLTFATEERVPIHPEHGTPQLYFGQLNTIAAYLQEPKHDEEFIDIETGTPIINLIAKKRKNNAQFTRPELKRRDDWDDWKKSEYKQLDLYEMQNMFGSPCKRPPKANIINLLWAYSTKTDGTKKSRCVCNGNPKRKGTVTLAHTFAACLEQPGARTFWATSAILDLIVLGADASNAFAEVPPPKAPLYVVIDQQYRDWWKSKGRGDIPLGYVLPVQHALQGHPESPRLWAQMIDKIIRTKVGLQPCTHEPCLYSGIVDGEKVPFQRQVDDFAVACKDINISEKIIDLISNELSAPMYKLGVIQRYNGVDITQTKDYIKIHNTTYIKKILQTHDWLQDPNKMPENPVPMRDDNVYQTLLDTAQGPANPIEKEQLGDEMNFSYRQALGELLFAIVTCRPDISFQIIKLSTFANNPACEHCLALKQIFRYLRHTMDEGIIYWRNNGSSHKLLKPSISLKIFHQQNPETSNTNTQSNIVGSVDSDWASDPKTRKSISGIVMYLGGGAIHYKTKQQDRVAWSSTEAEFVAAREAAKMAIHLRSILDEIDVPQQHATLKYKDNSRALEMTNARQPTKRTKHMETKHFAIQDWVEEDLLVL